MLHPCTAATAPRLERAPRGAVLLLQLQAGEYLLVRARARARGRARGRGRARARVRVSANPNPDTKLNPKLTLTLP